MKRFSQLAVPYVVWMALMLILPMILIALYSVRSRATALFRSHLRLSITPSFLPTRIFDLYLAFAFVAFKTTVICLLLGYPVAYFIARSSEKVQNILVLCITLPTWINMLVRTYAWIGLLSEGGIFQRILSFIGLGNTELLYTEGAVLLGMVYNFIPFMILQIHTSLCKMDHSLLEASADLGANPAQTFRRVTLPLSLPGVINGITLVFFRLSVPSSSRSF